MSAHLGPEAVPRDEAELGRCPDSESCDEELKHFVISPSHLWRSLGWPIDGKLVGREQQYSVLQAHMHMVANSRN
jgi:hypothetical protein